LNYRSPLEYGRFGAQHAMDIPLVFDNIAQPGSLTGTTVQAQRTADQMSSAFIEFARSGNPNNKEIPRWAPYEVEQRATTRRWYSMQPRSSSMIRAARSANCSRPCRTSSAGRTNRL
jgi:carboxylesterase type B